MVFAHIPRAQLLFALLSETFLTIRQNSLNVTVCMIARSSCRGYFIHSLSTLYYYNAPSLATRLTGDYRDRTFTGKCGPASLDTQYKKSKENHMTKILRFPCDLARTMRNTLREFLIVIATVAKASCNKTKHDPGNRVGSFLKRLFFIWIFFRKTTI